MEPGICGTRIRVQLSFSKKDLKIIEQVEMGHNRNKISYNCNIKEMKTKLQSRESGKYKNGKNKSQNHILVSFD